MGRRAARRVSLADNIFSTPRDADMHGTDNDLEAGVGAKYADDFPAHEPADVPTMVAIGASAGGLEALSNCSRSSAARTRVCLRAASVPAARERAADPSGQQDLVAGRPGHRRHAIEPSHVYVMPPNVQMEVGNGHFICCRADDRSQFTPIDLLLSRSPPGPRTGPSASSCRERRRTDSGIREIKAAGGITIAQTP